MAIRVTADRCAFYNCRFLGWQVRFFIQTTSKCYCSSGLFNVMYLLSLDVCFIANGEVQDTLYLHHGKQYLKDCYVEGSVDFIFGNSTALLEHCHIHCKSQGFITAQSRKSCQESTGYVFLRSVFVYVYLVCIRIFIQGSSVSTYFVVDV